MRKNLFQELEKILFFIVERNYFPLLLISFPEKNTIKNILG